MAPARTLRSYAKPRAPEPNRPVSEGEMIAAQLAGRDFPCPKCRYNLRDLPTNICPECGLEITRSRLRFGVAHWNRAEFYVGAAGLLLGFVPAVYAAVSIVRVRLALGWFDEVDAFNVGVLVLWAWVLGKVSAAWINWSGAMAAWPRWKHRVMVLLCWVVPAVAAGLAYLMRVF